MRCWVKSRNERNPYCVLYHSHGTAERNSEEGGDDVKSAWPLRPGLHTYYNAQHRMNRDREVEEISKTELNSDRRLQLACVKLESLVIADQHAAVNTFPGLVHTARHITKAGCTRSRHTNPQGREAPKVWSVIGVKS